MQPQILTMELLSLSEIVPSFIPHKCPVSEKIIRKALERTDGLTVLHSVTWQSLRGNRQADGEADFIILVPNFGVLVVEVKGGEIHIENGVWKSTDKKGRVHNIKDPYLQAKDSKFALLNFFKLSFGSSFDVPIVHAVIFPDIRLDRIALGINAPSEITIDKNQLPNIKQSVINIFKYWGLRKHLPEAKLKKILKKLAPTIQIKKSLSDEIEESEREIVSLTAEQTGILAALKRVKRSTIYGGAGTGKTVLAVEKARQLSELKFKTLLLCYNSLLKNSLKNILKDTSVQVDTYHSLVHKELASEAGSYTVERDSEWYEFSAPQELKDIIKRTSNRFDAIIIDEAQDFSPIWLNSIDDLLNEDGILYMFVDSHQNLYKRGWQPPTESSPFDLTQNCRNTRKIADKVAKVFNEEAYSKNVLGPDPVKIELKSFADCSKSTITLVEDLLTKDISPSEITVLSNSPDFVYSLRKCCAGESVFTEYGKTGIAVETINRFKGLENNIIVATFDERCSRDTITQAYVGLSRAKSALFVIATPNFFKTINWPSSR